MTDPTNAPVVTNPVPTPVVVAPPGSPDTGFLDDLFEEGKDADVEPPETDPTNPEVEEPEEEEPEEADPKDLEIEKWKSLSRKHERRSHANAEAAEELAAIKADPKYAAMTGDDKALAAIQAAADRKAEDKFVARLLRAEVKAAAAGRDLPVDKLLPTLNARAFLTEEGDINAEMVEDLVTSLAPQRAVKRADLGQGKRGTPVPKSKEDQLLDWMDKAFH